MNVADIHSLFAYDEWANDRVLRCAADLTEEQYGRHLTGSFPSVRETLAHVVSVEWVWLQRWRGVSPSAVPEWAGTAAVQRLRDVLQSVEGERAAFLESLTDVELSQPVSYRNIKGEAHTYALRAYALRELLIHVANHSTYHRGQLTNMFRQLGAPPPATDWLVFCDASSLWRKAVLGFARTAVLAGH